MSSAVWSIKLANREMVTGMHHPCHSVQQHPKSGYKSHVDNGTHKCWWQWSWQNPLAVVAQGCRTDQGVLSSPPDFGRSVTPILIRSSRLCPNHYYYPSSPPPRIFGPSYGPLKIVNVEAAKYLVGPDRKSSRNICRNDNITTKKGKTRKLPLECFEIFGVILKIIW